MTAGIFIRKAAGVVALALLVPSGFVLMAVAAIAAVALALVCLLVAFVVDGV
jgi:hypothetical protein